MRSIKIYLIITFIIAMAACNTKTNQDDDWDMMVESEERVDEFYSWYINEVYLPHINDDKAHPYTINIDSLGDTIYKCNAEEYFKAIEATGYFSPVYIENVKAKIKACDEAIAQEEGYRRNEAALYVEKCKMLQHYNWVGGQGEPYNDYMISYVEEQQTTSVVKVDIGTDGTYANTATVTLSKIDSTWYIDNVEL